MSNTTTSSRSEPSETPEVPPHVPVRAQVKFAIIPEWLLDSGVSGEAVKLYGILARYADSDTGIAFPKRKTLAERMGKTTRSVSTYLHELEEIGALISTPKFHPGTREQAGNYYTVMSMPNDTGLKDTSSPSGKILQAPLEKSFNPRTRTNEREPMNDIPPTPPAAEEQQGELAIVAESAPPAGGGSRQKRGEYPDEFTEFWKVYPKKSDKRAALKAWRAALKRTDQQTLLAAAAQYRDDPNRSEQFTKNAATWLNADSWENGPLPARGGNDWNSERQQQNRQVMMNAYQQQYGSSNPMMGEIGR